MSKRILTLGVSLVILCIAVTLRAEPFVDNVLKVTFPEQIATFDLKDREQYKNPGKGYSLRYQDKDFFNAHVYVYDNNRFDIGEGIDTIRVRHEFGALLSAFPTMEKMGKSKDLTQLGRGITIFEEGSLQFRWLRIQYRKLKSGGDGYHGPQVSEIYLSAKAGKFIKVRFTIKKEEFEDKKAEIDSFMEHLGSILGS